MLVKSEKINLNYAAQVVELRSPEAHPNADRLVGWRMQDGLVYTDNTYKEGEICVFFPLECQIDSTLIAGLSLFRDKTLNKNDSVGFFDEKARVKPLRLRKEPSMGFLLRISEIEKIYGRFDYTVGELFDTVNNNLICKKYIIKHVHGPAGPKTKKVKDKEIVGGQFNFHYDTHKLALHKDILTEGEICVISKKIHGCVKDDTILITKNGPKTIKEIVDNKLKVEILARDLENNRDIYAEIDDFYFLPNDGEWYEIELEDGQILTITGNNPVWMPDLNCYREAKNLKNGDVLYIND